jgi:hypothetical protein
MIVLPMAGLSSRFFKAGYTVPKYMLDLHGASVFAHALGGFAGLFGTQRFVIVCRDVYGTPDFVREQCAALGLPEADLDLVVLDAKTGGQAETVALGLRGAGHDAGPGAGAPLTIFNIDTFRPGFRHPDAFDVGAVDGYLEVFQGVGDHWSFARPAAGAAEPCRVAEVTEKVRISDLCSDGLYHFRDAKMFLDLYAGIEAKDPATLQGGERYVAPLYNEAIAAGADIRYALIGPDQVRFCGTPDEYDALRARPPFPAIEPAA